MSAALALPRGLRPLAPSNAIRRGPTPHRSAPPNQRRFAALLLALVACADPPEFLQLADAGPLADAGDAAMPAPDAAPEPLALVRAVPDHGPFTGGTRVVLRGTGLREGVEIEIGGVVVPAEEAGPTRLAIVTPMNMPGSVDIVARHDGRESRLAGGFTYDALAIDPRQGYTTGGTRVSVLGVGTRFDAGAVVTLGGVPCTDVTTGDPLMLSCTIGPHPTELVDLVVESGAETWTALDAFEYLDPASFVGGGVGGGPLDGLLTVTVVGSEGAIENALVHIEPEGGAARSMRTDAAGHATFTGEDLHGSVDVHVAHRCYNRFSVIGARSAVMSVWQYKVNAPPDGCGDPPTIGTPFSPIRLGFVSGELLWDGPNEFAPNPWSNVPPAGDGEVRVAYVFAASQGMYPPPPDAIVRVLESAPGRRGYPFRIDSEAGPNAIGAMAGLEDTRTGRFTPYVMGVARSLLVWPRGELTGVEITMNLPLDRTLSVAIDPVPGAPTEVTSIDGRVYTGPNQIRVSTMYMLESDTRFIRRPHTPMPFALDALEAADASEPFLFRAQPQLAAGLAGARQRFDARWVISSAVPLFSEARWEGDPPSTIGIGDFLAFPRFVSPEPFEPLEGRELQWEHAGMAPDVSDFRIYMGSPFEWQVLVRGDRTSFTLPDFSAEVDLGDLGRRLHWVYVESYRVPGLDFDEFAFRAANEWTADRRVTQYTSFEVQ